MSYPLIPQTFRNETAQVVTGTGNITGMVYTAADPVELHSFGMVITTAFVSNAAIVFGLDRRITAGSDTGKIVSIATLTTPATVTALLFPAGNVVRSRPFAAGSFAGPGPVEAMYRLLPGEQWLMTVVTAAAGGGNAGAGIPFIEFMTLPRQDRASTIELIVTS